RLAPPGVAGLADDPTLPPAERLERWLDAVAAAPPDAADALVAYVHGLGGRHLDHEHHVVLGALAARAVASQPRRASALFLLLAEEAPTASAPHARAVTLLGLMKRDALDYRTLMSAAAAYRPVVDWRPEAVGWTELRFLLREALVPVAAQGWARTTPAAVAD